MFRINNFSGVSFDILGDNLGDFCFRVPDLNEITYKRYGLHLTLILSTIQFDNNIPLNISAD